MCLHALKGKEKARKKLLQNQLLLQFDIIKIKMTWVLWQYTPAIKQDVNLWQLPRFHASGEHSWKNIKEKRHYVLFTIKDLLSFINQLISLHLNVIIFFLPPYLDQYICIITVLFVSLSTLRLPYKHWM